MERVCGADPPRALHTPVPWFTLEADRAGIKGTVLLACVIGYDGQVEDILVAKPLSHGLTEAAVATVSTWRFEEPKRTGKPARVLILVEVNFDYF